MNRGFRRTDCGFSLLELLLAVVMMAMVILGVAAIVSRQGDEANANVMALQLKTVGDAAGEYIKDNYNTLLADVGAANKVIITLPMLTNAGYLGAGFNINNAFNQNMCVVVRRSANSPNNLLGLVVTEGGNAIDDLTLGQIAATIGGPGGGVYGITPLQITGALGAWTLPTTTFAGATVASTLPGSPVAGRNCSNAVANITLAAGHPTMSLWFADGASRSASGTLYRNAVVGQPELNTMNTPLIMGAATVQTVGNACATNGAIARDANGAVLSCASGVWAKGSAFWGDPVANLAALGACNAAVAGKMVMVRSTAGAAFNTHPYVPYTCDGAGTWKAVAIDQNGDLNVRGGFHADGYTTIDDNMTVSGTANLGRVRVANNWGDHNTVQVGGSHFYGSSAAEGHNTYIEQDGNVYLRGASDNNPRSISANWMIGNYFYPQTTNNEGWGCSPNGLISKTSNGSTLSCVSGIWRNVASVGKFGGTFERQYIHKPAGWGFCWQPNPYTGGCTCPSGYSPMMVGMTYHFKEWDGGGFVCQ